MLNQDKINNIVELVNDLGYEAFAAGSSVYLDAGTATDIDVYINFRDLNLKKFDDDLLDQITMEDDFKIVKRKTIESNTNYASGCNFIKKVVSVQDDEGMIYDLIATDLTPVSSFPVDVLSTFDYGRIQLGYTKDGLVNTDAYEQDVTNKTLTLLHVYSPYHLKVMGKRIDKMQDRFPGHRIKIVEDFYKDNGTAKKVYKRPTKTGFLAQVLAAREANRIWGVQPVQAVVGARI